MLEKGNKHIRPGRMSVMSVHIQVLLYQALFSGLSLHRVQQIPILPATCHKQLLPDTARYRPVVIAGTKRKTIVLCWRPGKLAEELVYASGRECSA